MPLMVRACPRDYHPRSRQLTCPLACLALSGARGEQKGRDGMITHADAVGLGVPLAKVNADARSALGAEELALGLCVELRRTSHQL